MLTAKIGDNSPIISFPATWNFLFHRTAEIINFFTRRFSIRLLYAVYQKLSVLILLQFRQKLIDFGEKKFYWPRPQCITI